MKILFTLTFLSYNLCLILNEVENSYLLLSLLLEPTISSEICTLSRNPTMHRLQV